ncbi:hypothetical protein XAP6164_1490006 [Xanthomonas phaseoli pv. phaseoli]|nr:hypothetical protein XAP6164_1490006 [Xanthomonas phaseoli pv. phaseoli]
MVDEMPESALLKERAGFDLPRAVTALESEHAGQDGEREPVHRDHQRSLVRDHVQRTHEAGSCAAPPEPAHANMAGDELLAFVGSQLGELLPHLRGLCGGIDGRADRSPQISDKPVVCLELVPADQSFGQADEGELGGLLRNAFHRAHKDGSAV